MSRFSEFFHSKNHKPDRAIYHKKTSRTYINNMYLEDKVIKKETEYTYKKKRNSVFATEKRKPMTLQVD